MSKFLKKHRYLMARRFVQISLLVLYFGGNAWGWTVLRGNLSGSLILGTVPMSDPYAVLQMFFAGAIVAADALLGAAFVAFLYGLVMGRAFCSWVCPMNMVTDLADWLRSLVDTRGAERKTVISRNLRLWVLGLSLLLSALFGVAAFEMVSPVSMLHRGVVFGMGFGWAAVAAVFLFDLFTVRHGFCGHLCPLGGFYSLIGGFSLIRVKYDQERCTLCMECRKICPEHQVLHLIGHHGGVVAGGACTNCGRCVDVCEGEALAFGVRAFVNNQTKESR